MMFKTHTISVIAAIMLSGCGTIMTRDTPNWDAFGGRPYEAVAQDVITLNNYNRGAVGVILTVGGLISIPFDVFIDTVVLPIDLAYWSCGCHKSPAWDFGGFWLDKRETRGLK